MIEGLLETVHTLVSYVEKDGDVRPVWTSEMEKAMEHWAVIFDLFALNEAGILLLSEYEKYMNCVMKISFQMNSLEMNAAALERNG